jgi:hypothetical protein
MPLALIGRTKDAVVSVPASANWQAGIEQFLLTLTGDRGRIERHMTVLEQRLRGSLPWAEVLAGATLPSGQPMPASRRYAEMLVREDRLPLYDVGSLRLSLDLHNPGNEAGVPEYDADAIELALVADVGYFSALAPGSVFPHELGFEEQARRRAAHGALFGELVARLFEATHATFAYADIGPTGWVVSTSQRPAAVVHPAPQGMRPRDFLWSVTIWSPDVLDTRLEQRLERLTLSDSMLARVDRIHRPYYRTERRRLAGNALFLQYRLLFGSESRSERAAIDTPLAKQAGLRSTNLLFRS